MKTLDDRISAVDFDKAIGDIYKPDPTLIDDLIADRERMKKALWTTYEMLVADQDPYHVVCEAIDMEGK